MFSILEKLSRRVAERNGGTRRMKSTGKLQRRCLSMESMEERLCLSTVEPLVIGGFDGDRGGYYSLESGGGLDQARASLVENFEGVSFRSFDTLTAEAVAAVDVVFLSSATGHTSAISPLSPDEQTVLSNFVRDGGSVILLSDNDTFVTGADAVNESLIDAFDMDAHGTIYGEASAQIAYPDASYVTNGRFGTVSTISQNYPGGLDLGPFAVSLATNELGHALAIIEPGSLGPGSGSVVIFSDINAFEDVDTLVGLFPENEAIFLNSIDFVANKIQPIAEGVDVGQDLTSLIVQLNDADLNAALATTPGNYRVTAAHGDADGNGNPFDDGDETIVPLDAIDPVQYDSSTDRITVRTADVLFEDYYRLELDGDGLGGPDIDLLGNPIPGGTPGITDLFGNFIEGGDVVVELDLTSLGMVGELITKVEGLGLSTGAENSLTGKLEATIKLLGVDAPNDGGVLALLRAFKSGVDHWFECEEISDKDRSDLVAEADLIILGITLTLE